MRERCLQSLAILLAGLFSAERARANGFFPGPLAPSDERESSSDATTPTKGDEN